MPRRYLFIDGAFFRGFIKEMSDKLDEDCHETKIEYQKVGSGYDRVFFYDAYPKKKDNQSDGEFDAVEKDTERYFDVLSRTPYFTVRPALTRRAKRQKQKGVDVLLALDCLLHAVRNNIDEATIMTSDLDFFPLLEALLQTKTRSHLRYQFERTAPELIRAADFSRLLTVSDYLQWLPQPTDPQKQWQTNLSEPQKQGAKEIAKTTANGHNFYIMRTTDDLWHFLTEDGKPSSNGFRFRLQIEHNLMQRFGYLPSYSESKTQ